MKYNIEVTQDDIDKGIRNSDTSCPIAKAVRRATGNKKPNAISIVRHKIRVGDSEAPTTKTIKDFIEKFDSVGRKAVKPFSFVLRLK